MTDEEMLRGIVRKGGAEGKEGENEENKKWKVKI